MKKAGIINTTNKLSNRSRTLQLLFSYKILSRTDIAEYLNITTAAVTTIVNDFLDKGLVVQKDLLQESQPRAGRKKAPLCLNYDWKYILAIDIHSYYINIAVTNLKGDVIIEGDSMVPEAGSPQSMCSNIAKECIKMLWQASIPTEMILGAGITIIGPVNQHEGIALHPFRLFDEPILIRKYFEKEFPFPVAVESNVCSFLISEILYTDVIEEAQNILMLKWGPGVGSAMAIHGQIYKGRDFQSTEIGHNQIMQNKGKRCNCGRIGCLEPYISTDAVVDFIAEEASRDPSGELAQAVQRIGSPSRENLNQYLECTCDVLWNFIRDCAHSLAAVTNNAIHILAPDKLILMGDLFELDSIVSLFEEQLYLINPQTPSDLCRKIQPVKNKKYIGPTAIAVEQLLLPSQA